MTNNLLTQDIIAKESIFILNKNVSKKLVHINYLNEVEVTISIRKSKIPVIKEINTSITSQNIIPKMDFFTSFKIVEYDHNKDEGLNNG
jgi:hypothetical protein